MPRREIDYLQRASPGAKAHTGSPSILVLSSFLTRIT